MNDDVLRFVAFNSKINILYLDFGYFSEYIMNSDKHCIQ